MKFLFMKKLLIVMLFSSTNFYVIAQWQEKAPNSSNPYDSVGYKHNLGIIYAKQQTNGSPLERALYYGTGLYPNLPYDSLVSISDNAAHAALRDSTNYIATFMSVGGRNYTGQLISMVDGIAESSLIDCTIESIKTFEADIQSSDLPGAEKNAILCASSIARHSMYYWLENIDSSSDDLSVIYKSSDYSFAGNGRVFPWELQNQLTSGWQSNIEAGKNLLWINPEYMPMYKKGWLRRLLHVVVGDIVGGLVGAGLGSLTGSPVGTLAGAFFGAMSGSLAAADSEGML